MTVFVDEFRVWAPSRHACFKKGSSHLTADALEELHAFAESIGLRRSWFQDGTAPHYDLTESRRELALSRGAVFAPTREQARERIRKQRGRNVSEGGSFDWSKHGPWPDNEIECHCGAVFRSHSKWVADLGIVTQRACPSCGESRRMRRASADVETFTIGGFSEQAYASMSRRSPEEDVPPRLVFFGFEPLELEPGEEGRLVARPEARYLLKRVMFPATEVDRILFMGSVSVGAYSDLKVSV